MKPTRKVYVVGAEHSVFLGKKHPDFVWKKHPDFGKRENPTLEDLGFPQQVALYDWLRENTEQTPPIVDSRDVLLDPAGMLAALCQALGVPFSDRMLSWPAGKRDSDGVWADHWYDAVVRSTGFQPYREKEIALDDELEGLAEAARPHYEYLLERRLRA